MRRLLALLLPLTIFNIPVENFAQVRGVGGPLLIEPGAAARSMGAAVVGIQGDPVSVFYNPAAVAGVNYLRASFFGIPGYAISPRLTYEYYTLQTRLGKLGGVSLSLINYEYEEMRIQDGEIVNDWSATSYWRALQLAIGRNHGENLSYGIGVKYYRQKLHDWPFDEVDNGWEIDTYSFDLGFLTERVLPWTTFTFKVENIDFIRYSQSLMDETTRGISLGVSLSNIGPRYGMANWEIKNPQPLNLRVGGSWHPIESNLIGMTIAVAGEKELMNIKPIQQDGTVIYQEFEPWYRAIIKGWGDDTPEFEREVGGELRFLNFIFLRAGITKYFSYSGSERYYYNEDSYGIGFGGGGFRFGYVVSNLVKEHSILDAIKNPGVFNDYIWDYPNSRRGFSFSLIF